MWETNQTACVSVSSRCISKGESLPLPFLTGPEAYDIGSTDSFRLSPRAGVGCGGDLRRVRPGTVSLPGVSSPGQSYVDRRPGPQQLV